MDEVLKLIEELETTLDKRINRLSKHEPMEGTDAYDLGFYRGGMFYAQWSMSDLKRFRRKLDKLMKEQQPNKPAEIKVNVDMSDALAEALNGILRKTEITADGIANQKLWERIENR